MPSTDNPYVVSLDRVSLADLPRVGGKNASLGEMIQHLEALGVNVPGGFALTTAAYQMHLEHGGMLELIHGELDRLDVEDTRQLSLVARDIRRRIRHASLPAPVAEAVRGAYRTLDAPSATEVVDVAVRSSATAEDLPTASFAGQQDTYLFVRGEADLDAAIRACMASLFTDRAIVYRHQQGIAHRDVQLSVGVQRMVRSDLACAGVMFTLDTESGFPDVVTISGSWGLGELLVQGRIDPDEFWIHKPTARGGWRSIVRRELGDKRFKLVHDEGGTKPTRQVRVPLADRHRAVLSDDEIMRLAEWAMAIEDHYTSRAGRPTPMDLEWAKDGVSGELFIVQARPETVHARRQGPALELYRLEESGPLLLKGKSVGHGVATGVARIAHSALDVYAFEKGEVLVASMTDPDWNPILKHAAAVVTDHGGRTCHAAIVARELGIPCVVGTGQATTTIEDGQHVTVSCAEGEVGKVYEGALAFTRETIDPATLPAPSVPLMLNVASPDMAFQHAQLPSAGVGLARIEFMITDWIGIHPMALVHPERVEDHAARAAILAKSSLYESPGAFFIERLASGVALIAAAFHPRPVIVRFSDFKSNEYAGLLGGAPFEPTEANPMLGFRGAARYYDERYRAGFALECAAIRRVREVMGLTNVKVMIPFCRTVEEGRRVLREMEHNGLPRGGSGGDDLEVYMMCEIPNNVVLADEFSTLFDGFSIGSNDLTQLTLGIDRDSELLAHLFDERDPGVKRMISMVVEAAHARGLPVGLCGQAPSDHPEFAEFLTSIGIDSISVDPDSLLDVIRRLGAVGEPSADKGRPAPIG